MNQGQMREETQRHNVTGHLFGEKRKVCMFLNKFAIIQIYVLYTVYVDVNSFTALSV